RPRHAAGPAVRPLVLPVPPSPLAPRRETSGGRGRWSPYPEATGASTWSAAGPARGRLAAAGGARRAGQPPRGPRRPGALALADGGRVLPADRRPPRPAGGGRPQDAGLAACARRRPEAAGQRRRRGGGPGRADRRRDPQAVAGAAEAVLALAG